MTEVQKSMALFSGSVNPELAEEIAKDLNVSLGNVKLEKFANGEIYARYQESVRGADVFLVQSVCSGAGYDVNDALMELLIMVDAAKRASARSVSAVVAHYGYARQDRKAARASLSPPSSWPISWPRRAWTTSSPSTCTRTPSRVSSTCR